jgi:hypothetical protein
MLFAGAGFAQQQVISAQSGTVQYVEGTVYAGNNRVERKFGQFPSLQSGEELRTADGRAEVLLTPGAFLRLAENSSVRMVSNRLTDTRVEVLGGTVMVECDELLKDNAVSLILHGDTIRLQRQGLYRIEAGSSVFEVYKGEALVETASGQREVKSGKQAILGDTLAVDHFDQAAAKDDLYQWSSQRSSNLAYATVTASQSVLNSGATWNGGWMWSSLLDEWTFLPGAGLLYGPFGWGFWSPLYMGNYYTPVYYVPTAGAGGFKGPARNGSGTSKNPRPVRPAPGLAVAHSAAQSGDRFGGVAATSFRPGFYSATPQAGFSRGPAADGFNSGAAGPNSSAANASSGGFGHSSAGSAPSGGFGRSGGGSAGGGGVGGGHSGGVGGHR